LRIIGRFDFNTSPNSMVKIHYWSVNSLIFPLDLNLSLELQQSSFYNRRMPNHPKYVQYVHEVEKGPHPTWTYFWPAVNKRAYSSLTRVFFDPARWDFSLFENEKNWLLGEIFQTLTQPRQQKNEPTQPGSKNFDPDPSLLCRFNFHCITYYIFHILLHFTYKLTNILDITSKHKN